MKNVLAMLLALILTTSICNAATTKTNMGSNLKNAIKKDIEATKKAIKSDVEKANKEKLTGIFGDAPWTNKERLPDSLLKELIEHFK